VVVVMVVVVVVGVVVEGLSIDQFARG
jgi:hypothetical protein